MWLLKWWRNVLRWDSFKRRIHARLPTFHPVTGAHLSWCVSINVPGVYDIKTGDKIQTGLATLSIAQLPPTALHDPYVYLFNFRKRELTNKRGATWGFGI